MSPGAKPTSTAVVEAVAAADRVHLLALPAPLASAIEPDALDVLFRNGTGHVSFDYCGYEVTVGADGTVDVTSRVDA